MTLFTIFRTFLEILAVLLVAYAIYNADKVNAFEEKLIRALRYYRHKTKRMRAYNKIRKNRAFVLTVDNSSKKEMPVLTADKRAG